MRIQRNKRRFSRSWWLHIRTTSARISISAATTLASRISTRPSFITRKPPNSLPPPPSMFLLDRALKDDTRLRFLAPRAPMPEGMSVVPVDLAAFFVLVDRLGRNEALLLLTVKALRQRTGLLALRTNDLAWMLRSTNRRVMRWLDRLVRHRTIVYHLEDLWGVDTVMVEVIVPPFE